MLIAIIILIAVVAAASAETVLIATENTSYKRALVKNLVEKLEAENFETEVIDHQKGELRGVDPTEYKAVYVLNSGAQAKVRPDVLSWLTAVSAKDSNVIVHTTQTTDWDPPVKVDSITSASRKSNIDGINR